MAGSGAGATAARPSLGDRAPNLVAAPGLAPIMADDLRKPGRSRKIVAMPADQMKWFGTEQYRGHDAEVEVWAGRVVPATETPARAEAIAAALAGDQAFASGAVTGHGLGPVHRVHDPAMVAWLEGAWAEGHDLAPRREIIPDTVAHPAMTGPGDLGEPTANPLARVGYWCFDTMTPIVAGTYEAARGAVDIALSALDAVLDGERAAYALCRPPGHHASRSAIGGFCYLNSAAVTATMMQNAAGAPVAVLDLDFHHGNGTQQIFYDTAEVSYTSLHADPDRAFPYYTGRGGETGRARGAGANRNLVLASGCTDDEYLGLLDTALDLIAAHNPAGLVVSLGLDTYRLDPISDLGLTTEGYQRIGGRVASLGLPTVIVQEGGYHLPSLGINARTWLRGFLGLAAALTEEEAAAAGRPVPRRPNASARSTPPPDQGDDSSSGTVP
jgi:acetoin utilization deacetylase AcuC-like enzyme